MTEDIAPRRRRAARLPAIRFAAGCLVLANGLVGGPSLGPRPAAADSGEWASAVELPQDRGGQIARAWLDAYHSQDAEQMGEFHVSYRTRESLERRSLEDRKAEYQQIYGMIGPLRVDAILIHEPSEISLSVHSESLGGWFVVSFSIQAEFPYKLQSLSLGPGSPPESSALADIDAEDLAELVASYRAETGVPALAVAVIQDGTVAEMAFDGVCRIDGDEAVELISRYHIGSVAKSMTATVIASLQYEGLLSMDTTVGEVLVDIEMLEPYRSVTIGELLGHRAGVPAYTLIDGDEGSRLVHLEGTPTEQRESFVAQILMEEPTSTGTAGWSYSNGGYAVAGLMAERVSGSSYEELLATYVFEPVGMTQSGVGWPATPERLDQPHGHTGPLTDLTVQEPDGEPFGAFLAPAGDVHCSLEDLALYVLAHLMAVVDGSGPLGEIAPQLHETVGGADESYAAGWLVRQDANWGRVDEHSGSAGSYFAHVQLEPERARAYVVLANAGNLGVDSIARRIIESLREREERP